MCYKYDIIEGGKGQGKKRSKNDAVSSCYNYCVIGGHDIITVLYDIDDCYTTIIDLSVCLLLVPIYHNEENFHHYYYYHCYQ